MIKLLSSQIAEYVRGSLIGGHDYSVDEFSMNSRQVKAGSVFLAYVGEKFDAHQFITDVIKDGCRCIITQALENYDENVDYIVVESTNQAMLDLAREVRLQLDAKVIAVTGSNGKTTTKDILNSICQLQGKTVATRENHNNEIGVAQTILSTDEQTKYLVLEAGIDKLGDMDVLSHMIQPDIALITSVGLAHVDHFFSLETIAIEKCKLAQSMSSSAFLYYQGDKSIVGETLSKQNYPVQKISYGFGADNDVRVEYLGNSGQGIDFKVAHSEFFAPLQGSFQASNLAGAILVGRTLGFKDETIQEGIDQVHLTSLRLDVMNYHQATIILDAYKSNPESAQAALAVLMENENPIKRAVIADMLGLGEKSDVQHQSLFETIQSLNLDQVLFFGDHFKSVINTSKEDNRYEWFASFEALKRRFEQLSLNPCCILIKGSRSFELERLVEGENSL